MTFRMPGDASIDDEPTVYALTAASHDLRPDETITAWCARLGIVADTDRILDFTDPKDFT